MVDEFQFLRTLAFGEQQLLYLFVSAEHILLGFPWRVAETEQTEIRDLLQHESSDITKRLPLSKGGATPEHMNYKEKYKDDPILSKIEDLKECDIMRVLNASYIAERFFGKYRSWLSQKLNHYSKNGTPIEFTAEEVETLRNALFTLSIEIQEIADGLQ